MDKKFFGRRLKELRNSKCLTQAQLAEKVGLHEKQISKIESGAHFPTFENFIKILESLEASISDFDEEKSLSPSKLNAIKIIKNASEEELLYYVPVLEHLKKCILETKQKFYDGNY